MKRIPLIQGPHGMAGATATGVVWNDNGPRAGRRLRTEEETRAVALEIRYKNHQSLGATYDAERQALVGGLAWKSTSPLSDMSPGSGSTRTYRARRPPSPFPTKGARQCLTEKRP